MKTSVTLEEDVYKQLVNKSIESFGSTKGISMLINKYLREHFGGKKLVKKEKYSIEELLKISIPTKEKINAVEEIDVLQ